MSANAESAPQVADFVTLTQEKTANTQSTVNQDASGRKSSSPAAAAAQLASTKVELMAALRSFPDFPIPGINFIDILPLFQNVKTHEALLVALQLQIELSHVKPDVIVGLDARGFLFGPSLALRMGASFVPVRKQGKMPGPCVTAAYEKEYGTDFFQMQEGAIKPGQKVLIVDDIIATGKHYAPNFPFLAVAWRRPISLPYHAISHLSDALDLGLAPIGILAVEFG